MKQCRFGNVAWSAVVLAALGATSLLSGLGYLGGSAQGQGPSRGPSSPWRAKVLATPNEAPRAIPCLNLPLGGQVIRPVSCEQTGPDSLVVSGSKPGLPSTGMSVLISGQQQVTKMYSGSGPLAVQATPGGALCLGSTSASGEQFGAHDKGSDRPTQANCVADFPKTTPSGSSATAVDGSLLSSTNSQGVPVTSPSYYVFASDLNLCADATSPSCPLYQFGEYSPLGASFVVLDFGAPCYLPSNPSVYGTQMFLSGTCTPDSDIVQMAGAWVAGYQTSHGGTAPPVTVAIGTSNNLTGADPGYSLTDAQMQAAGSSWYGEVVAPVEAKLAGPAPIVVWGASDIEEDSTGNWYGPSQSLAWVSAYSAASPAHLSCSLTVPGFMADFGDDALGTAPIGTVDGWTAADLYQAAWGEPAACAVPEIYYSGNASEWSALNGWAASQNDPPILFTGVMSEPDAGLTPAQAWSALESDTAQTPQIATLTEIGSDLQGPLPAVGSVSPSGGSGAGGEEVVINGSNFVGVSGVLFGATPAEGYQVESSSVIDAVAPPDPTGVVPVTVETAVGSSGATAGSDFTYTDPNGHAAVAQGDGVVDVFGQGESGGLEHYWYLPGGSWAGAQQLGSGLSSVPSATTSSSGVVSAFWQGTDGGLWYAQYTPGTGWQPAVALAMGTLGGAPQVVGQPSGTIDVFWRGANNQLWHAWQNPGGPWEGPQDLGGSMASDPSPTVSAPGQVDVLWKGSDGNLWLTAYQPGAGWMAPNDLGFGPLGGGPQAVGQSSGTIDVFWDGASGQLWHAWYNPGSAWAGPQDLGGTLASDPSPTVTSAGHVDVFWKGSDGNLWEAYYQPGGSWVSPVDLGFGPLGGGPHAAGQPSGTVDVFWLGYGNAELWHAWSLNGSTWAGPQNLGGSLSGL